MQRLITGKGSIHQLASLLVSEPLVIVCSKRWLAMLAEWIGGTDHSVLHPPAALCQPGDIPSMNITQVVAIGGGKVIDFAKALIFKNCRAKDKINFIAVPTTAGSGSEATPFAVMYERWDKISIERSDLLPAVVIHDSTLLSGLSKMQKATSGADAFCQAIEAIWNKNSTVDSTEKAVGSLRLSYEHLPGFVHGDDTKAGKMLFAAYLSGQSIAVTRTTGPHALSYYLTARHNIVHGQAVALFLPLFFLYNESAMGNKLNDVYHFLEVNNAEAAFVKLREFFSGIGLAVKFSELDISPDVGGLIDSVNHERFANNPQPFQKDKLAELIKKHL